MIKFKLNNTYEYAYKILAGTYAINDNPPYESYTDGNEVEHRIGLRAHRVEGSFDMRFLDTSEYNTFLTRLAAVKDATTGAYPITLTVNNTQTDYSGNFFLEFLPVRNRTESLKEYMETFTVSIKEA